MQLKNIYDGMITQLSQQHILDERRKIVAVLLRDSRGTTGWFMV